MPYWGQNVTSQLEEVEETAVPGKKHSLAPSHWQLSHAPKQDSNPGTGETQLAVSSSSFLEMVLETPSDLD